MATTKHLVLKRNVNSFTTATTRNSVITTLNTLSNNLLDGEMVIGRYYENAKEYTLIGVKQAADNNIQYFDSANISNLINAETAERRAIEGQTGTTYIPNSSATYITAATNMNNADVLLSNAINGIYLDKTAGSGNIASVYKLKDIYGNQLGSTSIEIYKDQFLSAATYVETSHTLTLTFVMADGTTSGVNIDLSNLVDVYTGSNVKLTGYAKGTDSTDVVALDSTNSAFGKIENQIDAVKTSIIAATGVAANYTINTHAISTNPILNGTDIKLDGYLKATTAAEVTTADTTSIAFGKIAKSLDDVNTKVSEIKSIEGQTGTTYQANSSSNYITGATSMSDADNKLDAAIKAISESTAQVKFAAVVPSELVINTAITGTTIEIGTLDCGEY